MGNLFLKKTKMPASKSRSRTPVSKVTPTKKAKDSATKGKKVSASKSRSTTPVPKKQVKSSNKRSASNSKSVTPVKTAQKSAAKGEGSARKFYTVAEDHKVYTCWQTGTKKNQTVSDISKQMAAALGRSEESVRDRIKRYLSKLNQADETKLRDAAKKTPNHHIHFVNDKQGHPWKCIGKITSDDPSFFKASSAKKVVVPTTSAKKASPVKAARSSSKSPAPKAKASKSPAKGSAMRKRTPEKSQATPVKSQKKTKTAEKSASKSPVPAVPTFHVKGVPDKELQGKVAAFLGGLNSKTGADVKKNAEVLAEVVKGFSSSYGVELSDVMTLLAKEKNGVNCASVRSQLERM